MRLYVPKKVGRTVKGMSFSMWSLIIPTGEALRVVLQAGERIDTGGPGIDLLPDIVGESVIIAFCLRLTLKQMLSQS